MVIMYIYTFPQICPQTSCNFHAPMTHDINSKCMCMHFMK